ncbi:MAG: hypothetical protein AAF986_01885 [Pseudomonadota bacterium]
MTLHHLFAKGLAVFSLIFLAGCATSTPYVDAATGYGYGFSEQRIEDDRYRISFRGNSLTDRETVENYLLFRAAEVTLDAGYDYFIVTEDETERSTTYTSVPNSGRFAYYGYGRPFPYYGWGYRWDPFYRDVDLQERNRYTAMAYIRLGKGEKPAELTTAYDARQVVENLGSVVARPTPTQ